MVWEVAVIGSAANFASAEFTAESAEFSEDCAAATWAPSVVVSSVAMVTPAATCWPGCTVTVATRPLVAKSRLAVFVGWIVPVEPMVCRTVPSCAATVR
jgi:glyoxylate utilization-related uncharacterized protein